MDTRLNDAPNDLPSRVAVLEEIARGTRAAFERIDRRFDAIDRRFDAIDRRFEVIDRRFDAIDRRLETMDGARQADVRWLLGVMLGGFGMTIGAFGAILGVMAHGFHWI